MAKSYLNYISIKLALDQCWNEIRAVIKSILV